MVIQKVFNVSKAVVNLAKDLRRQEGGRNAIYYLKRLHFSHVKAVDLSKLFKKIVSPVKSIRRQRVGNYKKNAIFVPKDDGFIKLPDDFLSGTDDLVSFYSELFKKKQEKIELEYKNPFSLLIKADQVLEDPEEIRPIIEFSKQDNLFNTVSQYIGELPVISSVSLMYSDANQFNEAEWLGAQLFHRDMNERRQLHLLLPIWEVDMEAGPFTLLSSKKTEHVAKTIKYDGGRVSDKRLFNIVSKEHLSYLIGKPKEAFLVNPYSCFHCGARTESKRRLILIINYTSVFEGAEGQFGIYRAKNRDKLDDGDFKTRALLNLL